MTEQTVFLLHNPDTAPLQTFVGTVLTAASAELAAPPPPEQTVSQSGEAAPRPWDILVRWGNTGGEDTAAKIVVNRRAALVAALDAPTIQTTLIKAGLRANLSARRPTVNVFRVHAFDLQVLSLGRRMRERFGFQEVNPSASKLTKRVTQYGLRALYALGLDFGAVDIAINSAGALIVIAVNPSPTVEGRLANRYGDALSRFASELNEPGPTGGIRLGADPEFMIRSTDGRLIPASRFFPQRGQIGCDAAVIPGSSGPAHPVAELRPDPSDSPIRLAQSLRRLLLRASRRVPYVNIEFRAGSMPFQGHPIGGHIHFSGLPRVSGQLLRALDTYVGLPLFLIEDVETAKRRRPLYGYLGDFRPQPHGFEYRTPSSWLVSPTYARASLCLAKLVATGYRQLPSDIFADRDLVAAFYRADKEPFYALAERLFTDLISLPLYPEYATLIEPLHEMIVRRGHWRENADIRRAWRLPRASAAFDG
jgi:hypothetical protein